MATSSPTRTKVLRLSALVAAVSLVGSFCTYRLVCAGGWLPEVPTVIGLWEATDSPVAASVLAILGNPQALGRTYRNPFGDQVEFSLVTAGMFENYHDPTVCVGGGDFETTAVRIVPLSAQGRTGVARAMIFRHRKQEDVRILMYYWQQNRDGSTDYEARMGNFRDLFARFKTGFGSVVLGHQTVLVRIYSLYRQKDDPDGAHAQHIVHEIAQAQFRNLLPDQTSLQ